MCECVGVSALEVYNKILGPACNRPLENLPESNSDKFYVGSKHGCGMFAVVILS